MPNYNAIRDQVTKEVQNAYAPEIEQLKKVYQDTRAKALQAKAEIAPSYGINRATAYINRTKANAALPTNVLDRGYSVGPNGTSGLFDQMDQNIEKNYQNNMDSIGKTQDEALKNQQNNIDNLDTTYNNNFATYQSKIASDIDSESVSRYNTQLKLEQQQAAEKAREEAARIKAQADLIKAQNAAKEQAQKQLDSYVSKAQKIRNSSTPDETMQEIISWGLDKDTVDYIAGHVKLGKFTLSDDLNQEAQQAMSQYNNVQRTKQQQVVGRGAVA